MSGGSVLGPLFRLAKYVLLHATRRGKGLSYQGFLHWLEWLLFSWQSPSLSGQSLTSLLAIINRNRYVLQHQRFTPYRLGVDLSNLQFVDSFFKGWASDIKFDGITGD